MSVGLYLKARNSRILPLRVSAALPNWELRLAVEMLSSGSGAAGGYLALRSVATLNGALRIDELYADCIRAISVP